jgi:beta-lactamase regulating signal transducer with metallopeptidase domain/polyhydroxyalkanoate synthesis regulator phasin
MIETILNIGISNAIISLAIALVAFIFTKFTNTPRLAYLLWLLVLIKLLMPSFLTVPVFSEPGAVVPNQIVRNLNSVENKATPANGVASQTPQKNSESVFLTVKNYGQTYLPIIWGIGILLVLAWSLLRIFRFNHLLKINSEDAPEAIYQIAEGVSGKLNLNRMPLIRVTSAEISPMVWWVGGRVRIFIPSVLIKSLDANNLRLVIAHELAHVKRRDYLVRWIEWSAAILFWWNPVVRWAQHNLRIYEEIGCDALILSSLGPKPHQYATSLLSAVESFAGSALRPPSMASEVNSGGNLIRRINMILSNQNTRTTPRSLQILFFFIAALILPLGLVNAQEKEVNNDLTQVKSELKAAIEAGEITPAEAKKRIAEVKLRMVEQKLNAGVANGKITPEEAKEKLAAYQRSSKGPRISPFERQIKEAVAAGEITPEEGREKLSAYKMKMVTMKIQEAVAAGNLTPEEGRKKMVAFKLERAAYKLKMAVKSGEISEDQARAEYAEIKREMENPEKEN